MVQVDWNDPAPLTLASKAAQAIRMAELAAFPMRYLAGVDPATIRDTHGDIIASGAITLDTLTGKTSEWAPSPQPKETPMIEKKNFVTQPVKTPAGSLAQRHIGSLVTITLPSGAEITDLLVGVSSGVPNARRTDPHDRDEVVVFLENVGVGYDTMRMADRYGDFQLNPKATVLVRRPKPATPAKKGARK